MTHVLICEDDPAIRRLLTLMLEKMRFSVTQAVDGQEGLECLRESRPDLIISDLEMPRLRGSDLMEMVRKDPALNGTPFVLVSVATWSVNVSSLDKAVFLSKPFTYESLTRAIHHALNGTADQ